MEFFKAAFNKHNEIKIVFWLQKFFMLHSQNFHLNFRYFHMYFILLSCVFLYVFIHICVCVYIHFHLRTDFFPFKTFRTFLT